MENLEALCHELQGTIRLRDSSREQARVADEQARHIAGVLCRQFPEFVAELISVSRSGPAATAIKPIIEVVSRREYAKLRGVHEGSVLKAIRSGWIPDTALMPDKKILVQVADAALSILVVEPMPKLAIAAREAVKRAAGDAGKTAPAMPAWQEQSVPFEEPEGTQTGMAEDIYGTVVFEGVVVTEKDLPSAAGPAVIPNVVTGTISVDEQEAIAQADALMKATLEEMRASAGDVDPDTPAAPAIPDAPWEAPMAPPGTPMPPHPEPTPDPAKEHDEPPARIERMVPDAKVASERPWGDPRKARQVKVPRPSSGSVTQPSDRGYDNRPYVKDSALPKKDHIDLGRAPITPDPFGESMSAGDAHRYLVAQDFTVIPQKGGRWKVDGKLLTTAEMIDKAIAVRERKQRLNRNPLTASR